MHANVAIMRIGRLPAERVAAPIAAVPYVVIISNIACPAGAPQNDLILLIEEITAVVVRWRACDEGFLRCGHVLRVFLGFSATR